MRTWRLVLCLGCIIVTAGCAEAAEDSNPANSGAKVDLETAQYLTKNSALYVLGGLMSGPFRATVDLDSGEATAANAPPGIRANAARVRALAIPVSHSRRLSMEELQKLRDFAWKVWHEGATLEKKCPPMSIPMADAFGRFVISRNGVIHDDSFEAACMSNDAEALLHAVGCGANPNEYGCKK